LTPLFDDRVRLAIVVDDNDLRKGKILDRRCVILRSVVVGSRSTVGLQAIVWLLSINGNPLQVRDDDIVVVVVAVVLVVDDGGYSLRRCRGLRDANNIVDQLITPLMTVVINTQCYNVG
jgi:hypothetical protein